VATPSRTTGPCRHRSRRRGDDAFSGRPHWWRFVAALATAGATRRRAKSGRPGRQDVPANDGCEVRAGHAGAVSLEGSAARHPGRPGDCRVRRAGRAHPAMDGVGRGGRRPSPGPSSKARLAATLEPARVVNNDVLNFINTATGAIVAIAIVRSRDWIVAPPDAGGLRPGRSPSSPPRWASRPPRRRLLAPSRTNRGSWGLLGPPVIGAIMAAVLNIASNGLNQIYDFEIDRINKAEAAAPERAPFDGRRLGGHDRQLSPSHSSWPGSSRQGPARVLLDGGGAAVITTLYSVPPFRTKRLGIWAKRHDCRSARLCC